jgi:dUTP pyrophosphatase
MKIQIQKLSPNAVIPKQAHQFDAGYDLYASEDAIVDPQQRALIKTGIAVSIPAGYYGRIAPRSGLAHKYGINVLAGVVDATYRGELGVILINHGCSEGGPCRHVINKGERVAQLIIEKCHDVEWEEVEKLDETVRGTGGYASTGK